MDTARVTRLYLETLSTDALRDLADDYGIDVPEHLNRRFIIGELLEASSEDDVKENDLQESEEIPEFEILPKTYNETKISVVMRNPVWCYVYWDIKESELISFVEDPAFSEFSILCMFFAEKEDEIPVDTFEVPISTQDRERFVFIQNPGYYLCVALVAKRENIKPQMLVKTTLLFLPRGLPDLSSKTLSKSVSPVLKLSGLQDIRQSQYAKHRQSFS
ncbi:MAG TPA: DUF4912 domain-containing protein [Treponemataceae bacterium]|nr:DUF4912 domain-containing protein [Treponemataceae bacterium]